MTQRKSKNQIKSPENIQKKDTKLVKKNPKNEDITILNGSSKIEKFIGKYSFWIALGLIFTIGIIAFKDFLFLGKLYFFKDIGSDTINVDYPGMILWQNMSKENFFYTWSFNVGMGAPYYSGILTPFNLNIYTGYPIISTLKQFYGNNPEIIRFPIIFASFLTMGVLFYFYVRTIGISKYASLIGTIVFTYLGYTIMGSGWGHAGDVFLGISLLLAFEQFFKYNRWYFLPIALIFFGGNIYYVYLYGVFLIIYFVFRYIDEKEWDTLEFIKLSLQIAGLVMLGLAMNLVNSVNEILTIINSPRVSGHSTYFSQLASDTAQSSHFLERVTVILRTFSTDIMGNGSNFKGWYNYLEAPAFYCGLSTLIIFPQIFSFLPRKQKILYGIILAFWLLIAFIPFFRYTLLLYVGDYYKRGIDLFIPIFLIFFSVKALTAIENTFKVNREILLSSLVLYIVLLVFPFFPKHADILDTNIRNIAIFFLIGYSVLVYFFSLKNYRSIVQILMIIMVVIEAIAFSSITINRRVAYSKKEFATQAGGFKDNSVDAINHVKSTDKSFYRMEKDYSSGTGMHGSLNDAQAQNYFGTTNYSSFNQEFYIYFLEETEIIKIGEETQTRWAPGLRTRPLLQTLASVKYNLSKTEKPFMLNAGYNQIGKFGDVALLKNDYYVPFGFTYNKFIKRTQFKSLPSVLQKDLALLRAFIVEDNDTNLYQNNFKEITIKDTVQNFGFPQYADYTSALKKDTLAITSFNQNRIEGTIKIDSARMMFLSIPYEKGWKAIVDGKEAKLEKINIGFMGLLLEKGEHKIKIFHRTQFFKESLIISILSSLIFVVLFFIYTPYNIKTKLVVLVLLLISYLILGYTNDLATIVWSVIVVGLLSWNYKKILFIKNREIS